jgi:regulator of protease activity HflC (stomatin/prohibitin superfamily)
MFSTNRYGWFFRLTCKVMGFTLFFAVGLLFACMFSVSFGGVAIVLAIGAIAQQWILPILALLMAWIFVAVSVEALR